MSDQAQEAKYQPPDYGNERGRCPVRFGQKRCIHPDNHERHELASGWTWYANRPRDANDEINRLRAENARLAGRVEELEGAGHQALTVVRDALRWERQSNAVRRELEAVEANLSRALSQKPSGGEEG